MTGALKERISSRKAKIESLSAEKSNALAAMRFLTKCGAESEACRHWRAWRQAKFEVSRLRRLEHWRLRNHRRRGKALP
jgi:hypothetical protein